MSQRQKWSKSARNERDKRVAAIKNVRNWVDGRLQELVVAKEIIDDELAARERDLVETAWLAYGYLSAYEKTELFCATYVDIYKKIYAQYVDSVTAGMMKPGFPQLAANARGEISSLWRARQMADAIGVPYPFYLRTVMEQLVQWGGWKNLPRPNQLILETDKHPRVLELIIEKWALQKETVGFYLKGEWDDRFFDPLHRSDLPRKRP